MRRLYVVAFLVTVVAGCSGKSSPGGAPDDEPAGRGGRGGGQATAGSGGSAEGGIGGSAGAGGRGGMGGGTGGAAGEGAATGGGRARPTRAALSTAAVVLGARAAAPRTRPTSSGTPIPAKGDAVFKNMNTDGGCTVTIIDDPEHGKVRKFNRPPGVNRCEARGAAGYDTKEGDVVYAGMRYKLEAPMDSRSPASSSGRPTTRPATPTRSTFPCSSARALAA